MRNERTSRLRGKRYTNLTRDLILLNSSPNSPKLAWAYACKPTKGGMIFENHTVGVTIRTRTFRARRFASIWIDHKLEVQNCGLVPYIRGRGFLPLASRKLLPLLDDNGESRSFLAHALNDDDVLGSFLHRFRGLEMRTSR